MQTQAAVLNQANGPFDIEMIEVDEPQGNEVRVAIKAAGICHTDLVWLPVHLGCSSPRCWATKAQGSSMRSAPMSLR